MTEFKPYSQPDEYGLGRPQDVTAEKYLLGSLIVRPALYDEVFSVVSERDFLNIWHRWTWVVLSSLIAQNVQIDKASVMRQLQRDTEWDDALQIEAYVDDLMYQALTPSNARFYATLVAGDAMRRRVCEIAPTLTHVANDYSLTGEQVRERIAELIGTAMDVTENESQSAHASDLVDDVVNTILSDAESGRRNRGADTGLTPLDFGLSGLGAGDVTLIAARTNVGKSALALRIAETFCKRGEKVVYFSLEMSKEDLIERLIAMHTRIPYSNVRNRNLNDLQKYLTNEARQIIRGWDLQIDEKPGVTPQYIRSRCRLYSRRKSIDLIVVDHLHIMEPTTETDQEVQKLGAITKDLHNIARDLRTPILALCQLNRGPENRPDPVPTLRDIRGSGQIEENADNIIGVHRPDFRRMRDTNIALPEIEEAELHILKARNGPTGGMARVSYISSCVRFDNLSKRTEQTTTAQPAMRQNSTALPYADRDEDDPFAPEPGDPDYAETPA